MKPLYLPKGWPYKTGLNVCYLHIWCLDLLDITCKGLFRKHFWGVGVEAFRGAFRFCNLSEGGTAWDYINQTNQVLKNAPVLPIVLFVYMVPLFDMICKSNYSSITDVTLVLPIYTCYIYSLWYYLLMKYMSLALLFYCTSRTFCCYIILLICTFWSSRMLGL